MRMRSRSVRKRRRIPAAVLLFLGILIGASGSLLSVSSFRLMETEGAMWPLTLMAMAVLQLLLTLLLLLAVWWLSRESRKLLEKLGSIEQRTRTRPVRDGAAGEGGRENYRGTEESSTRPSQSQSEAAEVRNGFQSSPDPQQQRVAGQGQQHQEPHGAEAAPDPVESRYSEQRASELTHGELSTTPESAEVAPTEPSFQGDPQVSPRGRRSAPSWVGSLADVWRDYRNNGNGFFHAEGFKDFLRKHGIEATVLPGSELIGSKLVVGVTESGDDRTYLVPSFLEPPSAMQKWFDDEGSGDRTRRVTRIGHLAVLKKGNGEYSLVERGAVS